MATIQTPDHSGLKTDTLSSCTVDTLRALNFALDLDIAQSSFRPILLRSDSVGKAIDFLNQACAQRAGWCVEDRDKLEVSSLPASGQGILAFHGPEFYTSQNEVDICKLVFDRHANGYTLPGYWLAFIVPSADSHTLPKFVTRRCSHLFL